MTGKITWTDIYKEFRSKYPTLRKRVIGWQPYGYLTIILTCKDGIKIAYDYLKKQCVFLDE